MHVNTVKLSSVVSAPFMIDMDPCEHFRTHLDRFERLWISLTSIGPFERLLKWADRSKASYGCVPLDYICYTMKPL